jgi:hypothetical protein
VRAVSPTIDEATRRAAGDILDRLRLMDELERRHEAMTRLYEAAKDEVKTSRRERSHWAVALLFGMVAMFLFGTWLAGKVNCPAPEMDAGPAKQVGTAPTEEPNMMTVSIVHRFRHQNKG